MAFLLLFFLPFFLSSPLLLKYNSYDIKLPTLGKEGQIPCDSTYTRSLESVEFTEAE